jgi:wobble nucleotide-excising tRNase
VLRKINRIKNLGVFADYTWDTALPGFDRYNVIYGENGSGKTTLSRLLDCLKTGAHEEYPTLEYKIESQSCDLSNGAAAARKVRVFNADYVQLNIGQLEGGLKPILVIGEENKGIAEALAAGESELTQRLSVITAASDRIASYETARGKNFSDIAKTISEATSGNTLRTYRKNNAETAYNKLTATTALTGEQVQAHRATVRQEVMDRVEEPPAMMVRIGGDELTIAAGASRIRDQAAAVCGRVAISEAITRLRDHSDIAAWVEAGHALHLRHESKLCEFCGQAVPEDRWKQLEAHFSKADQELKEEIERVIDDVDLLRHQIAAVAFPDRLALYSDFRGRHDEARAAWDAAREAANAELEAVAAQLNTKLTSRATAIAFDAPLSLEPLTAALSAVTNAIRAHNGKTTGFDAAKVTARNEIEAHYLLSIRADVAVFDQKIAEEKALISVTTEGTSGALSLTALQDAVVEKKAQLSNAHKAGVQLTQLLQTFLGRNELDFHSGDDGYRVYRNGKPAKRLSEGERTAIAFTYFIVQLGDQEFRLADGVVVIDDPVSSLDSSSVYQAFAFLKNAVKDAKQVFLLTHNFSFLRLLLNWLENDKKAKKRYYMLICHSDANGRQSRIVGLDRALIDHPTEYHFLFKILATFQGDGTIASCYHIPNVARKVLETFLDFFVPGKSNLYKKLEAVSFDENKKTAIYKYANDNSHFTGQGFEPGLVQESQKNVTYLLEMISALAPHHYAGMMEATA